MSNSIEGSVLDEVMGSTNDNVDSEVQSNEDPAGADKSGGADVASIEKLSKAVEGMQSMLGKWGNEMGEMRQMVGQTQQVPISDAGADGDTDPFISRLIDGGENAVADVVAKVLQSQQTQQQTQQNQVMSQLKEFAPDFEEHHDDIVATLAEDSGATKQQITANLHNFGTPVLVNVYKRVQAEKRLSDAENLLKAIKAQGTVDFDQAKHALAKRPGSGDSFNPPSSTDLPKADLRSMDAEQLGKLMEQRGIKRT